MAIHAYALTTLAELKTYMGITGVAEDTLLESLIDAATDLIELFCNRRFKKTTYTDELYDGNGKTILFMKNYPIVTVTSMYYVIVGMSDELIDPTYHKVYENEGFIYTPHYWRVGHLNIKVTYDAGYDFAADGIPSELKQICNELAAYLYSARGKTGLKAERMGNYSVTYGSPNQLNMQAIPAVLAARLQFWRRFQNVF